MRRCIDIKKSVAPGNTKKLKAI